MQSTRGHVCWCVEFLRHADGTPAGRWEYFISEKRAIDYAKNATSNGARVRVFRMVEA